MNNPVTLHLIGYFLKKITKKPWLAEFRDPWAEYSYATKGPKIINRFLERKVIECADRVVWYDGFLIQDDYFYKSYHFLAKDKFVKLPYVGYDPDDFLAATRTEKDKFRIFYAGSFYGGGMTPIWFLKGLRHFLERNYLSNKQFEAVFAGDWCKEYTNFVEKLDLENVVTIKGLVSRRQCIEGYINSDVLLLLIGTEEGNEDSIPSKFWDYVGARRTILALVPSGARVSQIIAQQKLGESVNATNVLAISEALTKLYKRFKKGELCPCPSATFLSRTERKICEEKFAKVLNELASSL